MIFSKKDVVAVIDSGFGGVSVLNKVIQKFQLGDYIYYADNEFMPYGNKTKNQIENRINYIINYLKENYNANKFIIACNTASSCINSAENLYCMNFNKNKCYLATSLTKKNLQKRNIIADKTLAAEIEENILNDTKLENIVINHINKNKLYKYKYLILGCTHYELVEGIFKRYLPHTKLRCNSDTLIKQLDIKTGTNLNVLLIMSKYSKGYYDKFYKILKK